MCYGFLKYVFDIKYFRSLNTIGMIFFFIKVKITPLLGSHVNKYKK